MKRIITSLLSFFALLMFMAGCRPASPQIEQHATADTDETENGYYQQWFETRKNAQGIIPKGLHQQWKAHDAAVASSAKTSTSNPFENLDFLGPEAVGGRTRAIMMDMGDQETMFAGGVQGGFWRSEDMGFTWSQTNQGDNAENLAVTCMTQSRFNNNVIYYGTGDTKVTNGVGAGEGIFKSTDGGQSFSQLPVTASNSDFHIISCIAHDIKTNNTLYAGTEDGGLYRSKNGGNSWTQVDATGHVRDLITFPNGEVMFTIDHDGIYFSTSGDPGTFTKKTWLGFPPVFDRIEICKAPSDPDVVYAMFADTAEHAIGMFHSTDRGTTWTPRTLPDIGNTQSRHNLALGVHALDPNKVVAAAVNIRISHDAGATWYVAENSHVDYHSVAVRSNDPNYFWVGNDGGVYKHSWDYTATTTTDLNYGYGVTQFYGGGYHPVDDVVIAGAQDNGSWKVEMGTEVKVGKNDGGFAYVHQQSPNIAYRSWQGNPKTDGPIHMITDFNVAEPDYGDRINNNRTMNNEGYDFLNFFLMNLADGEQIFCRTDDGVWRTNTASTTTRSWDKITQSMSGIMTLECTRSTNPLLYIGGKNGLLQYVPTAGLASAGDEVDLNSTLPSSVQSDNILALKVHPNNVNTLYVGFSQYNSNPRIWKLSHATEASPVWTDISGDLPVNLGVNTIAVDPWAPDDHLYIGTDFGVYYTENGGTNWYKISNVPNMAITQVKIRPSDRKIFIITFGRGVWTLELKSCDPVTQYPVSVGFENGQFEGWHNDSDDDIDWRIGDGPTPTLMTGPFGAIEGSKYLYIESSAPNHPNKKARLLSPCYDLTYMSNPRIKWNYNMNGNTMGELNLGISTNGGGSWTQLFSRSSSAGFPWQATSIDLATYQSEHEVIFRFTGKTANGEFGDIALDHIELVDAASKAGGSDIGIEHLAIKAFPNPFVDRVSVQTPEAAKVQIYSTSGKLVFRGEVEAGESEIQLPGLAGGSYHLQVETADGQELIKLIKN